ncbi:MAG: PRC-barrel domain-containing protein [Clostridia bacterium]|nr:hypothetical protein [Clostridiales bacterium]
MKRVSDIVGMKVVDSEGSPVGEVARVLCSRTRGRVLGIEVKKRKYARGGTVVHYRDILSFGDDLLIINDKNTGPNRDIPDIGSPGEGEDIIGYSVITADGSDMGIIRDTVIGEANGNIEGYLVAGDLFEDLLRGRKLLKLDKTEVVGKRTVVLGDGAIADEAVKSGGLENLLRFND